MASTPGRGTPGWRCADASTCLRSGRSLSLLVSLSRRGSSPFRRAYGEGGLPGGLGNAGQLATVRHLADAHAAPTELAVDGLRPAAALAAGVCADRELGLRGGLED